MKKYVFIIVVVVFLGIFMFLNNFKLTGDCSERIFGSTKNELLNTVARGIVKDCGATTDYSTQFFIEKEGKSSDPLVILKGDHSQDCSIKWTDGNIIIDCSINDSDVFLKKDNYEGINIIFNNKIKN